MQKNGSYEESAKGVRTKGVVRFVYLLMQNPAKEWESELLKLGVAYAESGEEGVELYPKTKENIATP